MASERSERLSPLEVRYLEFDQQLIMVGVLMFESGEQGPPSPAELRERLASRLGGIDQLRRRVRRVPGNLAPAVLEEVPVDVDEHLFVWRGGERLSISAAAALPGPELAGAQPDATNDVLAIAAKELAIDFDLTRPPWRIALVPALADGRFAVIAACHHILSDGIGGVAMLLASILELEGADAQECPPAPAVHPGAPLRSSQLIADGISYHVSRAVSAARSTPLAVASARGVLTPDGVDRLGRLLSTLARRQARPPARHPFAVPGDAGVEILAWESSLSDLIALGHGFGATFNDVLLSALAGAIRGWHLDRESEPADMRCSFVARVADGPDAGRNPTARVFVDLPVSESSPLKRMRLLAARTSVVKVGGEPELVKEIERWAERRPAPVRRRVIDYLYNNPSANLVTMSNFPGVPVPVFLLGHRLRQLFPLVTLMGTYRLGIVVTSLADRAFVTCTVARDLPGAHLIAEQMQAELELLADTHRRLTAVRAVPLFASVSGERQDQLASEADEVELPAGTTIYELGDEPDYFYMLSSGSVSLRGSGFDLTATAPDFFGAYGMVGGEPRPVSARAESDVTLLRIDRDQYVPAVLENPVAQRVAEGFVAAVRAERDSE